MPAAKFYPDDSFLVSYPKSGNTWVRFILSNLLKPAGGEINFHNALDYVPDDSFSDLARLPRPRIIKSHEPFHRDFSREDEAFVHHEAGRLMEALKCL